jgi:NADPH:quinone reductase-like Zn-dependent oxidoreductase
MSCATAFTALFSTTGASFPPPFKGPTVPSGSSIVTLAASGPVGQMAVQFARVAGFSNIITTAGKRYEPSLKGLGATHVLDREDTKDGSKIRAIAGDIKVVIDMASKDDTLALALSILGTEGGTVVRVLRLDPNSAAAKTIPSNVSVKFILGIFGNNKKEGLGEGFYEEVHRWLEEGVLKPNEVIVFEGIERVNDAIDRQASKEGTSGKKIVVKFE